MFWASNFIIFQSKLTDRFVIDAKTNIGIFIVTGQFLFIYFSVKCIKTNSCWNDEIMSWNNDIFIWYEINTKQHNQSKTYWKYIGCTSNLLQTKTKMSYMTYNAKFFNLNLVSGCVDSDVLFGTSSGSPLANRMATVC